MANLKAEQQKVKEITDRLEEGLKELFESEKYKSYLSTMSKFHNYSFNNTLLIAMQKPDATLVAGYKAWQKNFERYVNHGEKAIGIHIHKPGEEAYEDEEMDILTGKHIDLEILEYVPDITNNSKAIAMIEQMIEQLPQMEVRGSLEKWLPEEKEVDNIMKLATEIDQYAYDFDTYEHRDSVDDRQAQIESIAEDIRHGNTEYLSDFLNAAISNEIKDGIIDILGQGTDIADSESVQNARRAKELLDKLAEYKPLAKIEEIAIDGMEEQNFNMVDNVLNNGAGEKALKEERRREQDGSAKPSLKARLVEKQLQVSGKGQQHEEQENIKKNHREM